MPKIDHNELQRICPGRDSTEIHFLIEYRIDPDQRIWGSLTDGTIETLHGGELVLFELLAGLCTGRPVIPVRGFPSDPSHGLFYQTHLMIIEEQEALKAEGMRLITVDEYRRSHARKPTVAPDFAVPGHHGYLFDPGIDLIGHITLDELESLFTHFELESSDFSPAFDATVTALRTLHCRRVHPRLNFWFTEL